MCFRKLDPDFFRVIPIKRIWHRLLPLTAMKPNPPGRRVEHRKETGSVAPIPG
jgi:hypothetical protein